MKGFGLAAGVAGMLWAATAGAQEVRVPGQALLAAAVGLPDSPGYSSSVEDGEGQRAPQPGAQKAPAHEAKLFDKVIEPGDTAHRLRVGDKILLGIRENATLTSVGGWVLSATYEQIVDSSPNYGQTGKGYAQRLGAAAARNVSENVFSDSVIAPILHQDPRYYRMGPGHNVLKRIVYAGTRGLITKTDGGRTTFNFSNVGGDLGGSAVTQLYYPSINRSFTQVMQTWGTSIGGDAVGYLFSEFFPRGFTTVHVKDVNRDAN